MDTEQLIAADELCHHYQVEYSFFGLLEQSGLIQITTIEERSYVHIQQLGEIEKFIRLHYDLDINMEGIEAIAHLLQRMNHMQEEINFLKNRLRLFER